MAQTTDPTSPSDPTDATDTKLKRAIGPGLLLLFIVGDVLGTGIYALTGKVAGEVGGVVWLPFLVAFALATVTACSYLELVTKYPRAAGAALYTHKAFGVHFLTFLVAFAVMSSGITSASTASRAFSENFTQTAGMGSGAFGVTVVSLAFMALIAAVNVRGVGESVKMNVVFTCIELTGLVIIILIGAWALAGGQGDFGRAFDFSSGEGDKGLFWPVIAATTLAFFAMVGFEDSVNMAEESKNPSRIFPKVLLSGLLITGVIYLLVSVTAIALVDADELSEGATPLLKVVEAGAPWFPLGIFGVITMCAVANSALINMLMAWAGPTCLRRVRAEFPQPVFDGDSDELPRVLTPEQVRIVDTPDELRAKRRRAYEFSFWQLLDQIARLRAKGVDANEYLVDLHFKVASPLAGVIAVALGIPLATRRRRRSGAAYAVGAGAVVCFVFWFAMSVSVSAGHAGRLPPPIAAWAPNVLFATVALWMSARLKS